MSMTQSLSQFVFVGSADGVLRAFRAQDEPTGLVPAGFHQCRALSFFAVGGQSLDGSLWIFVCGRESLEAFVYSPVSETFRKVAEATTAGSGTHLTVLRDEFDGSESYTLFLSHYHQHCLSAFRFREGRGFSRQAVTQPGKNVHQSRARGELLYVPCLGSNHIAQYRMMNAADGDSMDDGVPELLPLEPFPFVPGGPRHMAFLPHTAKALVLAELESRLELLELESDGRLRRREAASTPTHADGGPHWSSDIGVSPGGAFAYAINRDPPELVIFSVSLGGDLRRTNSIALTAPVRSFGMAPDGSHLQAGGEDGKLHWISLTGEARISSTLSDLGAIRHAEVVALGAAR